MNHSDIDCVRLKNSPIHGKGLFATCELEPGDRVIEYAGQIKKWSDYKDGNTDYTCLMGLGRGQVIDPRQGGNIARYVNHSCQPNCEALIYSRKVYIYTTQRIEKDDELTIAYSLLPPSDCPDAALDTYTCSCGAPQCRGTMLMRKGR